MKKVVMILGLVAGGLFVTDASAYVSSANNTSVSYSHNKVSKKKKHKKNCSSTSTSGGCSSEHGSCCKKKAPETTPATPK